MKHIMYKTALSKYILTNISRIRQKAIHFSKSMLNNISIVTN